MIDFMCECGATLKADEKYSGKMVKCPNCGIQLRVHANSEQDGDEEQIGSLDELSIAIKPTTKSASTMERPYALCRIAKLLLKVSGFLLIVASVICACVAPILAAVAGPEALGLFGPALVGAFAAVGALASAELLGGIVEFLIKHDCKSD